MTSAAQRIQNRMLGGFGILDITTLWALSLLARVGERSLLHDGLYGPGGTGMNSRSGRDAPSDRFRGFRADS